MRSASLWALQESADADESVKSTQTLHDDRHRRELSANCLKTKSKTWYDGSRHSSRDEGLIVQVFDVELLLSLSVKSR